VPLRTSARPLKPSAKKQSPLHYQQHAPRRSKKPKAHSSTVSTILDPLLSTQSNTKLIEISDKEEQQQQEEDEEDEEDKEEQEQEEDIEDDDAKEEEKEEEARSFKFKTT
jgi:hypothetical protein